MVVNILIIHYFDDAIYDILSKYVLLPIFMLLQYVVLLVILQPNFLQLQIIKMPPILVLVKKKLVLVNLHKTLFFISSLILLNFKFDFIFN